MVGEEGRGVGGSDRIYVMVTEQQLETEMFTSQLCSISDNLPLYLKLILIPK